MCGKLLRVIMLVHAFVRCGGESKKAQFLSVYYATQIPYVEMLSRSTNGFVECAALCSDECWFLKYEDNESGSGTCDLYILRDTYYPSLKFVTISNLYKKVYPPPPDNIFVVTLEAKTWDGARDFCQSHGGRLAIADSKDKVDRIYSVTGSDMWVGGHKPDGTTWKWLSGTLVTQAGWPNRPDENCLMLWQRYLADGYCSDMLGSVCEYQL